MRIQTYEEYVNTLAYKDDEDFMTEEEYFRMVEESKMD